MKTRPKQIQKSYKYIKLMTERRIQQSPQKCILRGPSGHLLYSTFETNLDSENARISMIK